jgi:peptidoglycan/xylan/chitin deacetylase (PgdA/CDA1 family)
MSEVMVLCYHALSSTWSEDISVKPEAFEHQIESLSRTGWTSATFTNAICHPQAARTVAITFDDAFASVKTFALPVLNEFGMTGTVFAPTHYVTGQLPLAWEGLARWEQTTHAAELTPMTWDDLNELAELGWEIGSHTRTHPRLPSLDDHTLAAELRQSREECQAYMSRETTSVAYPYGDFDRRVAAQAREAGYAAGATLARWHSESDPYLSSRIGIYHEDSASRFGLKVSRVMRSSFGSRLLGFRR